MGSRYSGVLAAFVSDNYDSGRMRQFAGELDRRLMALEIVTSAYDSEDDLPYAMRGHTHDDTVSADRGDTSQTLTYQIDAPVQIWASDLAADQVVSLSSTGARNGTWFRVVRLGLGGGSLNVGGLFIIPAATRGWAEVRYNGSAWVLTAWGLD